MSGEGEDREPQRTLEQERGKIRAVFQTDESGRYEWARGQEKAGSGVVSQLCLFSASDLGQIHPTLCLSFLVL